MLPWKVPRPVAARARGGRAGVWANRGVAPVPLAFSPEPGRGRPRGAASELLGLAGWLGRQAGGTWGRGAGDGRALGVPGWLGPTAALDPVAATAADPVSE